MSDIDEDPVQQAWGRVEERWDDPEAHTAFLGLCAAVNRLGEAGQYYRQVRDQDPARSAEASLQIENLLTRAMSTLTVSRTDPEAAVKARRWVTLAGLVTATLLTAIALILMLRSG